MNIFMLTETESGCYKWRTAGPAKYLSRRGHNVQVFSNDMTGATAPDVMVFYRAHFPLAMKLVPWCKQHSIRVVFDTDDALDLVPQQSIYYKALQPRLPLYQFLLAEADIVTTTTETLASHLRKSNPNVLVIPNSVDAEEWTEACPAKSDDVRIGWSGGNNHFDDLALMLDAVREVQKKNRFMFVLQGICADDSIENFYESQIEQFGKAFAQTAFARSIKNALQKLAGIRTEFHPFVPPAEHANAVRALNLDIGLAPLLDDAFNRNKSCVKFYEYAMSGAVTVASNVLPYSAEVPLTAKNNRESWKLKLEQALESDRVPAAREQRDWVLTHRNIETNAALWEQALAGGF